VVDARGEVVCALSHSDLRALTPNDFGLLALPLGARKTLCTQRSARAPLLFLSCCCCVWCVLTHASARVRVRSGEFLVLQRTLAASPRAAGLLPSDAAAAAGAAPPRPLGRAPDWRARLPAAAPLEAVRADAPLRELLAKMLKARVHRVFVIESNTAAQQQHAGVVSMTDVLRAVADARCA
jgi:hypothetical protein